MIELTEWIRTHRFPDRPWLVLGKGPTFDRRADFDLSRYNLLALNHVVRALKVDAAHMVDVDVVAACAERLLENGGCLLMPRRPHVGFRAGPRLLEEFFDECPVLRELAARGRLVWYNSSKGEPVGGAPVIPLRFFSAVAAFHILARMGVKQVRSLGVDGGRGYAGAFADLEGRTMLANGQASFDAQFAEINAAVKEHGMDYEPLVEPMRVFVGTDESQVVAARVLEHSIRTLASGPVDLVPMLNLAVPLPKDQRNRPRTGFSFARFLIPKLCGYRGRALYLDADMQVFSDLAELWRIPFGPHKVLCTYQTRGPASWKDHSRFQLGRQMSVLMLDCARLDWDIDEIVRGLDEGRYTYEQLLFELCLLRPDEIADTLPPEWNCLEHYEEGRTKLLHYTVVPTQPWKNDDNPLAPIWMECFREALAAGDVPPEEVEAGIRAGYLKPSLAGYLHLAPGRPEAERSAGAGSSARVRALELELAAARAETARVRRRLEEVRAELQQTWTWKIGRVATGPLGLVKRLVAR